jgi:peptidoglycan/LPS O-acetylase OafA/YrhL
LNLEDPIHAGTLAEEAEHSLDHRLDISSSSPQADPALVSPSVPALTGIRILAALAVYASHLGPPHNSPTWLKDLFESGYMGVTIFFTLSGFVLTINYFERLSHPSGKALWGYLVARFARIYPLYILVLLFIMTHEHAFGGSISGWWEHVLAIQTWNPSVYQAYSLDGPEWSIGVEFFLYACFPGLVLMFARVRRPQSLLVVALCIALTMIALTLWFVLSGGASLPWSDPSSAHRWLYRNPLPRLGDFTLGIIAARLYVSSGAASGMARIGNLLIGMAALVILGFMIWPSDLYSAWSWDVAYAIPSAVLIFGLAVAPRSFAARMLSLRAMILMGESSYALYLIHQPALAFFGASLWTTNTSVTSVLYELFILGAIICLAIGLHIAIERPARLHIRRLINPLLDTGKTARAKLVDPAPVADRAPLT